jgi:hypothetical protein
MTAASVIPEAGGSAPEPASNDAHPWDGVPPVSIWNHCGIEPGGIAVVVAVMPSTQRSTS